jgi:hypothetical protein
MVPCDFVAITATECIQCERECSPWTAAPTRFAEY